MFSILHVCMHFFRSRWYDEETNTNIQFAMCLLLVLYHLIICFLKIFKAKKFGMRFWGLTFGPGIFGVLLEVLGILFWFYFLFIIFLFFAPIHLKSGVFPGLLPDYHMQSTQNCPPKT